MAATRKTTTRTVPSKARATRVEKGAVKAKAPAPAKKYPALRRQAEARLRTTTRDVAGMPVQDVQRLVHDLQVHQIELEMQIEELRRTQGELEATRDRYVHLYYDCAPMGYLTLDAKGIVLEANLPASTVLKMNWKDLLGKSLLGCVAAKDQATLRRHLREILDTGTKHTCEVQLARQGHASVSVQFESVAVQDASGQQARVLTALLDVTARTQAEDALRERERLFRTLAQGAPVGIFRTDASGGCLYVNDRWCEIAGISADAAAGSGWTSALHPEDQDRVTEEWTKAARSHRPFLSEYRFQTADHTITWVVGQAQAEHDPHGDVVVGYVGTITDITAHKKAEMALTHSRNLLQSVIHTAPIRVFWKDRESRYLGCNQLFAQDAGTTAPESLIGKIDDDLTWKDQAELYRADDCQVMESGLPKLDFEEPQTTPTGERIWLRTSKVPLRDGTNQIIGVLGVYANITEHKLAAEALRRSELRLNEAQGLAQIGSWELDLRTHRLIWSDEIYRIFEIDPAAFRASYEGFLNLVHPDDREMVNRAYSDSVASRTPYTITHRLLMKDGRIKFVQERCQTDYLPDGTPERSLGTVQDITERTHMEDALRQREHALRVAIEERERIVHDLHDGILQSLFAVGLSLEVSKSMLSSKNHTTAGPPLEQAIDQLNRVMREVRNFIAGLGSDLLQGKDLKTALQQMLASLTAHQPTRVRLVVEERAAQAVSAEQALHLFHIVQEAVSNCLRHSRAPVITVSLTRLTQGIRLRIRDNGRGFTPKAVPGTGHGLGNMAARAQQLGGRLTIVSKRHEGTCIVLDLPNEVLDVRR